MFSDVREGNYYRLRRSFEGEVGVSCMGVLNV